MLSVQTNVDRAVAQAPERYTRAIRNATQLARVNKVAGRSGVNITRRHLRRVDAERGNDMGGKRSHFYAAAARATFFTTDSGGADVHIAQLGMALRYFGGTVRPVNAKHLAIPANAKAYGRSPREFNDLEPMIRRKNGRPRAIALVQRAQTPISIRNGRVSRSRAQGGEIYFWLVDKATQRADKTILPDDQEILDHVTDDIIDYLDQQLKDL